VDAFLFGIRQKNFFTAPQILEGQARVASVFGVHPLHCEDWSAVTADLIERNLDNAPRALAWGEIGLDYFVKPRGGQQPDKIQQRLAFRQQLEKAVRRDIPIVIHGRDAETDLFKIMKELVPRRHPIHRHCVTSPKDMTRFLEHFENSMLGYTGKLIGGGSTLVKDAVRMTPISRLLVETDSPYFPPPSFASLPRRYAHRAHPGCARYVLEEVAKLKNLPLREVSERVLRNTQHLYGWSPPPL
jgi:TatD DNase family protein